MMELPYYATRRGKTVYVETAAQAFDVVDYVADDDSIVIRDRRDSLEVAKLMKAFRPSKR